MDLATQPAVAPVVALATASPASQPLRTDWATTPEQHFNRSVLACLRSYTPRSRASLPPDHLTWMTQRLEYLVDGYERTL